MQQFRINPTRIRTSPSSARAACGRIRAGVFPASAADRAKLLGQPEGFPHRASIKLPRNAQQQVFRRDGLDSSFADSVKAFFKPAPRRKAADAAMIVDFQPAYVTLLAQSARPDFAAQASAAQADEQAGRGAPAVGQGRELSAGAGDFHRPACAAGGADPGADRASHRCKPQWRPRPTSISWIFPLTSTKLPAGKDKAGGGGGGGERMPDACLRAGSFRAGA